MLDEAIDLMPIHPDWYIWTKAHTYLLLKRFDEAADLFLDYHQRKPDAPDRGLTLVALARAGRHNEARSALASAIARDANFSVGEVRRLWHRSIAYSDPSVLERQLATLRDLGVPERPPTASRPVIAVLPFDNMSGDPEQDYFADGITEDIITELQRRRLLVIARNSTFAYKGRAVDVREVARELGASHLVEGSVRRAGDAIKVTAQLLDAASGEHLWAETYEEALTPSNIFAIQERISGRIATAIGHRRGAIAREGQERAQRAPPESLASYECVLLTQSYLDQLTQALHGQARDCLEGAVESEPDYVQAWVALAGVYLEEHMSRYNPRPDPLARALAAAHEAVRRDPTNADAHAALALVYFFAQDIDSYFTVTEQALSLSPNDAWLLGEIGHYTAFAGDWDRGVAMIEQAKTLDPLMPLERYFVIGHNHLRKGEADKALAAYLRIDMPEYYPVWRSRAIAYAHLGRLDEAKDAVSRMLELYPDYQDDLWPYLRDWNFSEDFVSATVEGLRLAGLDIPDEPLSGD